MRELPALYMGPGRVCAGVAWDPGSGPRRRGLSLIALLCALVAILSAAEEPVTLGFETLASFRYEFPDESVKPATPQEIPAAIKAFSGKRAVVSGYMLPLQLEEGKARQFVLVRNQASCCYGLAPALNEYILVTMTNGGVRPIMDTPVSVVGTIKVGETYEGGLLVGIYQLDGEALAERK